MKTFLKILRLVAGVVAGVLALLGTLISLDFLYQGLIGALPSDPMISFVFLFVACVTAMLGIISYMFLFGER